MADGLNPLNTLKRWPTWLTAFGEVLIAIGSSELIVLKVPAAVLAVGVLFYPAVMIGLVLVFQMVATVFRRSWYSRLLSAFPVDPDRGWLAGRVGGHLLAICYGVALGAGGLSGTVPQGLGEGCLASGLVLLFVMWLRAQWAERHAGESG
jgi:hypothetical protein